MNISALINDYEHKLETEEAIEEAIIIVVSATKFDASGLKLQILLHKQYILYEMLSLHVANTYIFSDLHLTTKGSITVLNPRIWLNISSENVNNGVVTDGDFFTYVSAKGQ